MTWPSEPVRDLRPVTPQSGYADSAEVVSSVGGLNWTMSIVSSAVGPVRISKQGFGEVAADWDRLTESSGSFFQTRRWVESWMSLLEPGAECFALVAYDPDGVAVGLLPLAWMKRRLHRRVPLKMSYLGLAGSGAGAGDHLGPISVGEFGSALLQQAYVVANGRPLYLESLAPEWKAAAIELPGAEVVRRTACPASVRERDEEFSASWTKKARKNDRRRQRLLDEHGVVEEWIEDRSQLSSALNSLRVLHEKRWAAAGGNGLFDDARMRFLVDLALSQSETSSVVVLILSGPSGPVGALLGLRHRDTFSVYKTGWDPDFSHLGIGMALGSAAMRWSEANGLTVFDYLRGPRSHKDELGCEPVTDTSVMCHGRFRGRVLSLRERMSSDGVGVSWR